MKLKDISISTAVLGLFIFLSTIIITISITLQYFSLKDLAIKATEDDIYHITENIENDINNFDKKNSDIILNLELFKKYFHSKKRKLLTPTIINILNNNNSIYSVYISESNGNFYQVINLKSDHKASKNYLTNKHIKWLILNINEKDGKRVREERFLDEKLNILKTVRKEAIYDPRIRPWYKSAINSNQIIKTKPYKYASLDIYGITYAKKLQDSNCVIALDVSLKSMSNFFQSHFPIKGSEVYLLGNNNLIISKSEIGTNINKTAYNKHKEEVFPYVKHIKKDLKQINTLSKVIKLQGKPHYLYISRLKTEYYKNELLAVILPIEKLMSFYTVQIFESSLITISILLLITPLVWVGTKLLIRPIERLDLLNKSIYKKEYKKIKPLKTNIKEIKFLSSSLMKLSNSIKEHEKEQRDLMDSFIKLIASAIDAKSKYTGGHCERVPILTMMLAKEASNNTEVFKDFSIKNEEEERELNIAAWLHDCGKVTTPEYVVDKATKLETIYNRIHEIRTRFELIHRDLTIKSLENILNGADEKEQKEKLQKEHEKLYKEFEIIAKANIGGEFMDDRAIKQIEEIAQRTWMRYFDNTIGISRDEKERLNKKQDQNLPQKEYLLSDKFEHKIKRDHSLYEHYNDYGFKMEIPNDLYNLGEIYNLCIRKGTLTNEERFKINEHIIMTIIMLDQLPFLDSLKNVPEYAGGHHETLIGTGYPKQLTKEQMSLPARIIAIADVFEALTSSDRPYKEAKTLSESIKILSIMVEEKHLDEDLFKMFLESGIYKKYAQNYLESHQIDEIDISKYI